MDRLTNPIMSVNWMHIVVANCYSIIKLLRAVPRSGCMSRANMGLSRNDKQQREDGISVPLFLCLLFLISPLYPRFLSSHLGELCHSFLLNYLKDAVSHS